jgi:hypothetical protein
MSGPLDELVTAVARDLDGAYGFPLPRHVTRDVATIAVRATLAALAESEAILGGEDGWNAALAILTALAGES